MSVIATVALNATNLTASYSAGTLRLAWPPDHIGWHVETNASSLTDPATWFPLAGSEATNEVNLPIDVAQPNELFLARLRVDR
ncbi:MAG: hypothetical protein ACTHLW_00215 [Verrucomicrobiota bacterium]